MTDVSIVHPKHLSDFRVCIGSTFSLKKYRNIAPSFSRDHNLFVQAHHPSIHKSSCDPIYTT
jgi:hypothetical protein